MEYSEDQIRGFKEDFAKKSRLRVLVTVLVVVLACGLGVFASVGTSKETELLGVAIFGMLLLMAVIYLMRTSRCPACGRIVGRPMWARFCDQCGVCLR